MTGFTEVIIVDPVYQVERGRIYFDDTSNQLIVQSSAGVHITSEAGTDIQLDPSNAVNFTNYQFPKDDGLFRQVLSTNGAGQLSFIALAEALNFSLGDLDNVTITGPTEGQVLTYDSVTEDWINTSLTFTTSFIELTDTPPAYTGAAGQVVTVNPTEDGLIFTTVTSGGNVDSVFARTGDIVATTGDYNTDLITNASTVTGTSASDALDQLDNDLQFKADKISGSTDGNLVGVTFTGNIEDSGFAPSDFATSAQGTLADTATQPGDNVSTLTNDAGYITLAQVPADAVDSVDGRTGVVTLGDLYATAAQGTLADTALQPLDNISELTNDAGYLTNISGQSINDLSDVDTTGIIASQILVWDGSTFVPGNSAAAPVDSVFGRTGVITALSSDYASFYANTAQGALADTSIQPLDNISELTNDSGYITNITSESIGDLSDVDLTGIVATDTLVWDGSTFVPGTGSGAANNWITANKGVDFPIAPTTTENYDIAIGNGCIANGPAATAIGFIAKATYQSSIALGSNTKAYGQNSIAIGNGAGGSTGFTFTNSVSVGAAAVIQGDNCTAVGYGASIIGDNSLSLGRETLCSESSAIAIGYSVTASAQNQIIIGTPVNTINVQNGVLTVAGSSTNAHFAMNAYTTANRPATPVIGSTIFDTTLNQPVWFDGTSWVPAATSTAPVDSVFGRTGVVTAQAGDYSAYYATTAQGALADTALQTNSVIDGGTF